MQEEVVFIFRIRLFQVVTITVRWKLYCSLWGCQFSYHYKRQRSLIAVNIVT